MTLKKEEIILKGPRINKLTVKLLETLRNDLKNHPHEYQMETMFAEINAVGCAWLTVYRTLVVMYQIPGSINLRKIDALLAEEFGWALPPEILDIDKFAESFMLHKMEKKL